MKIVSSLFRLETALITGIAVFTRGGVGEENDISGNSTRFKEERSEERIYWTIFVMIFLTFSMNSR